MEEAEIDVEVLRETEVAYLISDGDKQCWIPKSQVSDTVESKGKIVNITIPEWLALKEDLI